LFFFFFFLLHRTGGANFKKGDIICAAILISFGTVILVIMLICLCLETQYCRQKVSVLLDLHSRSP